ncbi:MAG: molybdopterin converting factor subunit 1 [Maricaulaceae bacterium]
MVVTVKYFAWVREAMGRPEERLSLEGAQTLAAVRARLLEDPAADVLSQPSVRAAVNGAIVDMTAPVADGDEIAFFPPLTGG